MISETIVACSNCTQLLLGFCVIQEFRHRAKLLSSFAPILEIVDVRMGQSNHAKLTYTLQLLPGFIFGCANRGLLVEARAPGCIARDRNVRGGVRQHSQPCSGRPERDGRKKDKIGVVPRGDTVLMSGAADEPSRPPPIKSEMVSELVNCYIAPLSLRDRGQYGDWKAIMATVGQGTTTSAAGRAPNAFHKDVEDFSGHCAYIRSVYILGTRIWRDSSDSQRKMMKSIAPSFFWI
jgi:hypothetical protein